MEASFRMGLFTTAMLYMLCYSLNWIRFPAYYQSFPSLGIFVHLLENKLQDIDAFFYSGFATLFQTLLNIYFASVEIFVKTRANAGVQNTSCKLEKPLSKE